jgi:wyosine [tRNA(Phe)-imidazoG37] synthetase (radical SAM superfamily)
MTQPQLEYINRLTRQRDLSHEDVLDLAEEISGTPVVNLSDLDTQESSQLIERLQDD